MSTATPEESASDEPLHVINYGGGTQSSTLLLMAAAGLIEPAPVAALFADVGDEPASVYHWNAWVRSLHLPFPILTCRRVESLSNALRSVADGAANGEMVFGKAATLPGFTLNHDGSHGILRRQCTGDYKVDVIRRATRRLMAQHGATRSVNWIGISTDEAHRMKPSGEKDIEHRYPLAMELKMSRQDCINWIAEHHGRKPPRSACVFCPYHSDDEWRRLRDEEPEAWQQAIEFERTITHGLRGTTAKRIFLHSSRVPLDEVDLDTAEDRGQLGLWGNECEGFCGV